MHKHIVLWHLKVDDRVLVRVGYVSEGQATWWHLPPCRGLLRQGA